MRLTAGEWLARLQGVLGSSAPGTDPALSVQPVRQVTAPYVVDIGPQVTGAIQYDARVFKVVALATYVQIIPRGYYDSVQVSVVDTSVTNISLPLFVALEKIVSSEGIQNMGVSVGNFMIAHAPFKSQPAQSNENSLEINLPLTNAPLIVWCDDGRNPSSSGTFMLQVALMTRRH